MGLSSFCSGRWGENNAPPRVYDKMGTLFFGSKVEYRRWSGGLTLRDMSTLNPQSMNPMKRLFTILALASAFSLAVPVSTEAAPPGPGGGSEGRGPGGGRSSHVGRGGPGVAMRGGPRGGPGPVGAGLHRHHHPQTFVRGGFYRYRPGPVLLPCFPLVRFFALGPRRY